MNTVIKKLLGIITVVAIVAAAGWNFSQGQNEVEMSDLSLANVEALARYEGQGDACTEFTDMECTSIVVDSSGNVSMNKYYNMYPSDAC